MNTKKIGLGVLGGVFAFTGLATTAYGAEGERSKKRGPQVSEEVRAELKTAFESSNYDAYTAIASENEFKRTLSQEQFEAKVEKRETKQEAKEAILDGDYNAWRGIVGDDKATDVTSSNFYLLTNLAEARETEDEEAVASAKAALEAAGIEKPNRKGKSNRGNRTEGERPNFGERNGIDRESVSELSDDEKQDLLEQLIKQIKERLGLS